MTQASCNPWISAASLSSIVLLLSFSLSLSISIKSGWEKQGERKAAGQLGNRYNIYIYIYWKDEKTKKKKIHDSLAQHNNLFQLIV